MDKKRKGTIKFISTNSKESTVKEMMDYVNLYVDGNYNYDDDFCGFDFEKDFMEQTDILLYANQAYNVTTDKMVESIGKFNWLKTFIKRVVRKSIYWYIKDINMQQVEFNAYSVRVLNQQARLINQLYRKDQSLVERIKILEEEVASFEKKKTIEEEAFNNDWYLNFENHFRGEESTIRQRLLLYVPYFSGLSKVVDLGCGRGEFLSIMSENGIKACGVDMNEAMVNICLKKGLKVYHEDCLEFLEAQKDESIEGIFASQVIEHLSLGQLRKLVHLSYKKLSPNGVLILETVNPMALGVFCYGFYIDPTHIKPVHPAMLRFMAKQEGFSHAEVNFINEFPEEYHFDITDDMQEGTKNAFTKLDKLVFGCQDYYLLCRKS